jgi:hypothetical protein
MRRRRSKKMRSVLFGEDVLFSCFMRMSWRRMKSVLFYEDVLLFCFHEDVVEEDEKCFVLRRCSLFSICGNATRDGTHHFERGGDVTPG